MPSSSYSPLISCTTYELLGMKVSSQSNCEQENVYLLLNYLNILVVYFSHGVLIKDRAQNLLKGGQFFFLL